MIKYIKTKHCIQIDVKVNSFNRSTIMYKYIEEERSSEGSRRDKEKDITLQ